MNAPTKYKYHLYLGLNYIGGPDQWDDEAVILRTLVRKFFLYEQGPLEFWLFYKTETGQGYAAVLGSFMPAPGAGKEIHRVGVGVAPIPTMFQMRLLEFGPQWLKWDGKHIVANGH
jgi:hypothetical protein